MKKYNSKQLEQKEESVKKVSNIFFGCKSCNYEWNQSQYESGDFYEGLKCPKCNSDNTVAV